MIRAGDIRLAVVTVRRSPEYIHSTLASLFLSGPLVHRLKGVHLVVGGAEAEYLNQYRHHRRITIHPMTPREAEATRGWTLQRKCCFNFYRAMTIPAADCRGLCICEDDVLFRDGFLEKLLAAVNEIERTHTPPDYLLTAYLAYGSEQLFSVGKHSTKNNAGKFYGTQCMYYPRETAAAIAEFIHQYGVDQQFGPYDLLIREYARQNDALFGTARSLVQHVGVHSTGLAQFFHRSASFHEEPVPPTPLCDARGRNQERVRFRLRESLGDVVAALSFLAQSKGLELIYHVGAEVPESVVGEPARLRQVLSGFLKGAIERTAAGEIVVRIEVESMRENEVRLHFAVIDSCSRIPPEEPAEAVARGENGHCKRENAVTGPGRTLSLRMAKTLGVLFQRLAPDGNSTAPPLNGSGLTASEIATMLGGKTWVESRPDGRGRISHFTARLSSPTSAPGPIEELIGLPVLVVDDNAANRGLLVEMLSGWGMKPIAASGGRQALYALQQAKDAGVPLGLVLLDAEMPDMDGYSVVKEIRQAPYLTANVIMMLNARGKHDATARCREAGVRDYLNKPILHAELIEALRYFVGTYTRVEGSKLGWPTRGWDPDAEEAAIAQPVGTGDVHP